jgi:hypothetical protein
MLMSCQEQATIRLKRKTVELKLKARHKHIGLQQGGVESRNFLFFARASYNCKQDQITHNTQDLKAKIFP